MAAGLARGSRGILGVGWLQAVTLHDIANSRSVSGVTPVNACIIEQCRMLQDADGICRVVKLDYVRLRRFMRKEWLFSLV